MSKSSKALLIAVLAMAFGAGVVAGGFWPGVSPVHAQRVETLVQRSKLVDQDGKEVGIRIIDHDTKVACYSLEFVQQCEKY